MEGCVNCPLKIKDQCCCDSDTIFDRIEAYLDKECPSRYNNPNTYYGHYYYFEDLSKDAQKLILEFKDLLKEILEEEKQKQITKPVSKRDNNKEKEMERTLKQLTDGEKQMTRLLVQNLSYDDNDYTEKDIAKAMNVTTRTVAAIRAHVTMGSYR
jgi:hypothetical protein